MIKNKKNQSAHNKKIMTNAMEEKKINIAMWWWSLLMLLFLLPHHGHGYDDVLGWSSDEAANATLNPSISALLLHGGEKLFAQYFRFHGVRNLNFIVCEQNVVSSIEFHYLVRFLLTRDFYVRIFNGADYTDTIESRPPFSPPFTFRVDNQTRRRIRLQLPPIYHKTGVIMLEFASPCGVNALRWSSASENNFFNTNRFWLLITESESNLQLIDDDEEIFLPPDSEVRVMVPVPDDDFDFDFDERFGDGGGKNNSYTLIDVYKTGPSKSLKRRLIAVNATSVANITRSLQRFGSAISHRGDLEGERFDTGLVIAFPDLFTNIDDISLRHIDTIPKVNHRLTADMGVKLNFRFNTFQTDNYGWRQSNGSFDGLMGSFQRYELDFARNAIFMRLDRIALVDFIAETFRIRAGIMFRQPPLSAVSNIFALPFARSVWISILVLMIFTSMIMALELTYAPYRHDMQYLDCAMFVWGAMCQQSFYITMGNRSGRAIIFTTFVATLFLFTSFSANIVALLQSPSDAIQSLSDLSTSPLEIGVQDTVYNKIYFNESTDPVTSRLYHNKIAAKGNRVFMRPVIGMQKLRTSLFAYQVEFQAGYKIISDTFNEPEKCGLKELEPFQLPIIAIPTRKNFPYRELFRRHLRLQREVGLMNHEELKWFPQRPRCENAIGGFVSIGLTECRYAVTMFITGICLAFTSFALEVSTKILHNLLKIFMRRY